MYLFPSLQQSARICNWCAAFKGTSEEHGAALKVGIPQPMLRLAESKLLFPCTAGHERMLCHPVFGAVSLFFPPSLFESRAVEDVFYPLPTT